MQVNKELIKEIVRQVGYLPELHEDARSEKKMMLIIAVGVYFHSFLSLTLVGGERSTSCSGRAAVGFEYEAGWAPEPF
jgi:hypothetical protein